MQDRILSDDLVPDVAGAEALLDKHQEHKVKTEMLTVPT